MSSSIINRVLCAAIVGMLVCSSFFGILAIPKYGNSISSSSQSQEALPIGNRDENIDRDESSDWLWSDGNGDTFDIRSLLDSYHDNSDSVHIYHTSSYSSSQDGFDISYQFASGDG